MAKSYPHSRKSQFGLAVLLLLAIALSFFIVGKIQENIEETKAEYAALAQEFSGFALPEITHNGKKYAVRDGTVFSGNKAIGSESKGLPVMRTARYVLAHKLDPIFALSGSDAKARENGIAALEASIRDIEPFYDEETKMLLKNGFYPLNFLRSVHELEPLRRKLLEDPSDELLGRYHRALLEAIDTYQTDIATFRDALSSMEETLEETPELSFTGGNSDFSTFDSALALLSEAALGKRIEEERRYACFKGKEKGCTSPQALFSALKNKLPVASATPAIIERLPNDISFFKEAHRVHNSEQEGYGDLTEIPETYVLETSTCVPGETPVFYHLWKARNGERDALHLTPLYELQFHNAKRENPSGYMGKVAELDLDYLIQVSGNLYMCPDAPNDFARISAALHIREMLRSARLVTEDSNFPEAKLGRLLELQERIAEEPIIHVQDVELFAGLLFEDAENEADLAETLGKGNVSRAMEIAAVLEEKTSSWGALLANAGVTNSRLADILTIDNEDKPFWQMYLIRSFPALFYLSFNESIIESSVSFYRELFSGTETFDHMTNSTELREAGFSDEDIVEFMRKSGEVYDILHVQKDEPGI